MVLFVLSSMMHLCMFPPIDSQWFSIWMFSLALKLMWWWRLSHAVSFFYLYCIMTVMLIFIYINIMATQSCKMSLQSFLFPQASWMEVFRLDGEGRLWSGAAAVSEGKFGAGRCGSFDGGGGHMGTPQRTTYGTKRAVKRLGGRWGLGRVIPHLAVS